MMRKTILSASLAAASLVAGLTACNNDKLTSVNANPNAPEKVESSSLFTNATIGALSTIRGTSFEHGTSGLWDQHYAEIQYAEADLNQPRNATTEGLWNSFYAGPLQDYRQILTQSATQPEIAGPTLVMRAFVVETMTDLWGDIPFSEAGQGSANFTPKYDTQAAIYDSIFASLSSAASMMSGVPAARLEVEPRFAETDPVFGQGPYVKTGAAQSAAWIRLANSLHARAAMRISMKDKAKATAELAKALAGPVLRSNADNAAVIWPGGVVSNPLCLNWQDSPACGGTRDDQRISERFVDTLKVTGDPRLAKYAEPTLSSEDPKTPCDTVQYRGFPNGHSSADVLNPCSAKGLNYGFADYSRPTLTIRLEGSPSYIMTYSELLFIEAEAAERGMFAGNPAQLYTAAITASMEQWGVDPADIATYLASPNVVYKGGAQGLKQIAYEKWVSLFNLETEAYAEYRRLDYPVLKPGPEAVTNTIPTRLPYPDIENSLNAANLSAAKGTQGNTDITGKVWWDTP
jgi:Starch-binding associating with outer membrane